MSGVPFFLIRSGESGSYAISGAQPAEAFLEVFHRVLKEGGGSDSGAAAAAAEAPAAEA